MIYDIIKELCDERGLSIRQLEIRAGVGNGVIAGWKTASPRVDKLQQVADALGVPLTRLLKGA